MKKIVYKSSTPVFDHLWYAYYMQVMKNWRTGNKAYHMPVVR